MIDLGSDRQRAPEPAAGAGDPETPAPDQTCAPFRGRGRVPPERVTARSEAGAAQVPESNHAPYELAIRRQLFPVLEARAARRAPRLQHARLVELVVGAA